ncbi:MAG: glycoside hydrolase family protein [Paludibacter sp.]
MYFKIYVFAFFSFFAAQANVNAQTVERVRPAEWKNLVYGGRFMDRFLPMPSMGKLTSDTWGGENVLPRYIDNGIENRKWSFWGGNIKESKDGKFHFYVCGWLESSVRGHNQWGNSIVFHAVADNSFGPFVVQDTIGNGHNPEIFQIQDGRYIIYVIGGYYIADNVNGPWTYGKFDFNNRDRILIEGNSNFTYAQREDKSYLMICRGGGQWISQTGLSTYNQLTPKKITNDGKIIPLRAYPDIKGRFEDPVVWRDNVQYNLVVNDWLGRIAYYLRSKDGVSWKVESGEAYMPGIAKREDGSVEGWFKFERMKVFQDQYGRATQANFAVIDIEKVYDKGSDIHSSKNIGIPLTVGRLLTILDKKKINANTQNIRVKISAEPGFNPQTDIDIQSLRFGNPEDVNYGRGSKILSSEKSGNDLIVTFNGVGNGIPEDEFAAKMLGKTIDGKLFYGYARLPEVNFIEPILSACLPVITPTNNGFNLKVEVQNFGQVASKTAQLKVAYIKGNKEIVVATGKILSLKPYEKTIVDLNCAKIFESNVEYNFKVTVQQKCITPSVLHGKIVPQK